MSLVTFRMIIYFISYFSLTNSVLKEISWNSVLNHQSLLFPYQMIAGLTQCTIWFITKIRAHFSPNGASLVAQGLKRLPAVQETGVQSLSREYPLEKEMAIHSSILAWRIPWSEDPGRLQSMGSQRVRHN